MDESEFKQYIQKPRLGLLRRRKFRFDLLLIAGAAVAAWGCCDKTKDMKGVLGEVMLASGSMPFLLSMPLILADMSVSFSESGCSGLCHGLRVSDGRLALAYFFSAIMTGVGVWCGLRGKWIGSASAEVFAEVAVIYGITTLFRIPTVQDDGNSSNRFLTAKEKDQLERSGYISTGYAGPVTFALGKEYHSDMLFKYPADVSENFESIDSVFMKKPGSDAPRGAFVAKQMNDCAPGWNCAWYVAALGRCDANYLSNHLLEGLFTCLSGAAQCNRFITQQAIDTLAQLFFQTKSQKISHRILQVWMVHEIADVRMHCVAAIHAIGEPLLCAFMKQMNDLDSLANTTICKDYFAQQHVNGDLLQLTSLTQVADQLSGSMNARLMSLIAACCVFSPSSTPPAAMPAEVKAFLRTIDQNILRDRLENHLVKELALEAVARIASAGDRFIGIELKPQVWEECITQLRTSVFKQVRLGAKKALQAAGYPHAKVFECFGGTATKWYIEKGFQSMNGFLTEHLPADQFEKIRQRLQVMERPTEDLAAMFTSNSNSRTVSFEPAEDPVMLLYAYLATAGTGIDFEILFIQERLNSLDYFERYVGLLCIGALANQRQIRLMRRTVCPGIVQTELISDVRDLALAVLDDRANNPTNRPSRCAGCCSCCAEEADEVQVLQSRRAALSKKELEQLQDRTNGLNR